MKANTPNKVSYSEEMFEKFGERKYFEWMISL